MSKLNTDIYNISEYIDELKKKHIEDVNENTLMMSTFGYIGEVFSNQIQNGMIVASELGNEIFPIRAKFEKNILNYAITSNIDNINASPAKMDIQIGINEDDLLNNMYNGTFILDCITPIYIENFEFHLDYNIKITKTISSVTGENIYLAQYDMSNKNPLSNITKPYLLPPVRINMDNYKYLFIYTTIQQVEFQSVYSKIISNDSIENKSFEFEYDSQLSYFDLYIKSGDTYNIIEPIYDGMFLDDETNKYCYYTYLSNNLIRIKFIKSSFEPKLNDEITVRIRTTRGSSGNFSYKDDILVSPESDVYTYNNLNVIVKPLGDSELGIDKKSIEELKRIIPKENLSRGNVTSNADLQNYFNILDTKNNRIVFIKKIDNQFERVYYSYLLLKDSNSNVIPTNTVNIDMGIDDFNEVSDNRLIIKPGCLFKYDNDSDRCIKIENNYTNDEIYELEKNGFLYTSPYLIIINQNPLSISYYLNILNRKYYTNFSYINNSSFIQFISTAINLKREFLIDRNTYKLDIIVAQNINEDRGLIQLDTTGIITDCKVRAFCVFYNKEREPIRYSEASLVKYNDSTKSFNFRFNLITNDIISKDSSIKILNLIDINTTGPDSYAYLPGNCFVSIYIVAELDEEYGRNDLDLLIPELDGYTVCNRYDIDEGIDFFINYSDVTSSKVTIKKDNPEDLNYKYCIDSIPVLKYSFTQNEGRIKYFIDNIITRKLYIDNALGVLEDSFGIDFKLFNTYGPSNIFKIGFNKEKLNSINISLKFRMKFDMSAPNSIKDFIIADIKLYMENINEMSNFHVSKLMTYLTNKFTSIEFIEFVGINGYDTSYQYILRDDSKSVFNVPEFLNITSNNSTYTPDITIDVI